MFLLDTNIVSEPIRHVPDPLVLQRWNRGGPGEFYLTVICLMELRFGAARAVKPGATWARIQRRILPRCTVLPFTAEDALRAGEAQATLARSFDSAHLDRILNTDRRSGILNATGSLLR